ELEDAAVTERRRWRRGVRPRERSQAPADADRPTVSRVHDLDDRRPLETLEDAEGSGFGERRFSQGCRSRWGVALQPESSNPPCYPTPQTTTGISAACTRPSSGSLLARANGPALRTERGHEALSDSVHAPRGSRRCVRRRASARVERPAAP